MFSIVLSIKHFFYERLTNDSSYNKFCKSFVQILNLNFQNFTTTIMINNILFFYFGCGVTINEFKALKIKI